jgi:hypothetical protein
MTMRDYPINGVRPSKTITERQRGTYSTEQGFPAELPPLLTLLRIPNIVHMEFELKQVICDTFHSSYVLIDPLPIIYIVPRPRSRPSAPAEAHNVADQTNARPP